MSIDHVLLCIVCCLLFFVTPELCLVFFFCNFFSYTCMSTDHVVPCIVSSFCNCVGRVHAFCTYNKALSSLTVHVRWLQLLADA
jgi:hypothetical protein